MAALRWHISHVQQEVYCWSCNLTSTGSHHNVGLSSTAPICAFCCLCRLDAEAKTNQLAELSASKASLEHELAVLTDSHAALTQQLSALQEQVSRLQGSLTASEEAKAAAEVRNYKSDTTSAMVRACPYVVAMQLSHILLCRRCKSCKL